MKIPSAYFRSPRSESDGWTIYFLRLSGSLQTLVGRIYRHASYPIGRRLCLLVCNGRLVCALAFQTGICWASDSLESAHVGSLNTALRRTAVVFVTLAI